MDESSRERGRAAAWQRMRLETSGMIPFTDPSGSLVMGLLVAVLSGIASFMPNLAGGWAWMVLLALFGLAMIGSACSQIASNRLFRLDLQRANGEWQALVDAALLAARQGTPLTRILKERGYRQYFLRRWLVAILAEDLPKRSPAPTSALLDSPSDRAPDERTWLQLRDDSARMLPVSHPGLRIAFGILLMLGSLGFLGMNGVVFQWMILFFGLGTGFMLSGFSQLHRDRTVREELHRARRQWPELQRAAQVASETGESFARELTKLGYREYFVRRWIATRLGAGGTSSKH